MTDACCLAREEAVGAKSDELGRGATICVVSVGRVDVGRDETALFVLTEGARDDTLETVDIRLVASDFEELDLGSAGGAIDVRLPNEGMGGRAEEDRPAFTELELGMAFSRDGWNDVDGGGGGAILADFDPPPKNFLDEETTMLVA